MRADAMLEAGDNCHEPDGEMPPYIPVSAITRQLVDESPSCS